MKKIDIAYSITGSGYEAWLTDGNKGSFEKFLEAQARINDREYILEEIFRELKDMTLTELKGLLEMLRDRGFVE